MEITYQKYAGPQLFTNGFPDSVGQTFTSCSSEIKVKFENSIQIFNVIMCQSSARIKGVGPDINCGEDG